MMMTDPTLEQIAEVVTNPKIYDTEDGKILRCGCPAHNGQSRSCAIRYGEKSLLASCHSKGCGFEDIARAIRERLRTDEDEIRITIGGKERQPDRSKSKKVAGRTWDLHDADGNLIAHHVRTDFEDGSKKVVWKRPDGQWGLGGTSTNDLPLYGSQEVAQASLRIPVVVTEGEKAADALRLVGVTSVGTVTGSSGTPCRRSLEVLRNRVVILWPDNDEGGYEHMGRVAEGLVGVAREIRWFEWPGATPKDDAADHPTIRNGGSDKLMRELSEASLWSKPPAIPGRVFLGDLIENGIEPPEELLKDILLAGKAHNIYAPGGVGKTWVLVWLTDQLIRQGKRVVIFDLENGFRTYAERFEEMGSDTKLLNELVYYYPFPIFDRASYEKALEEIQPDIVMFDSWIGFLAADGRDENVSNDISMWAESYSKPALRRSSAVLVLDHVPHEEERERGSSRKRDEMDVVWRLSAIGDFDREKTAALRMNRMKDREGWLPAQLMFRIGGDSTTGLFVMERNDALAEKVEVTHLKSSEKIALRVLREFGKTGATTAEWLEEARQESSEITHKQSIHKLRRALIEKGEVEDAGGRYIAKASTQHIGVSGNNAPHEVVSGYIRNTSDIPKNTGPSQGGGKSEGESGVYTEHSYIPKNQRFAGKMEDEDEGYIQGIYDDSVYTQNHEAPGGVPGVSPPKGGEYTPGYTPPSGKSRAFEEKQADTPNTPEDPRGEKL